MKLKKEFTFSILIFTVVLTYGQQIDFNKKSREEAFIYETQQDGELVDSLSDYGILVNPINDKFSLVKTNVLLYKRSNDNFDPQLHIWYHFSLDYKNLMGKRYNWGLYNPSFNSKKQRATLEKLQKQENAFIKKYKQLQKDIQKQFGKPAKMKTIADDASRFIENIFWENDELIIGLSIVFTRRLREIPDYGLDGDYKIEVMVTYK